MTDLPERPFRSLFVGGGLAALLAAALYFTGLAYHRGFLQAFYIDEGLVPFPFDRSVAVGFEALMQATAHQTVTIALLACGLYLMYFFWYSVWEGRWLTWLWRNLKKQARADKTSPPAAPVTIRLRVAPAFTEALAFLALFLVATLPAFIGYRVGEKTGADARQYCERGVGVFSGVITLAPCLVILRDPAVPDERWMMGYLLDRSPDTLVFYTKGTARLLPLETVSEVRYVLVPDTSAP